MSWLIKKPSKAIIAGMNLTREKAQKLSDICQWLENDLRQQNVAIDAFPSIMGNQSFRALSHIQQRHSQITKRIGELNLCIPTSAEPWLKELDDAKATMARKVKVCNEKSQPFLLGWKEAAKQYWPLIADTYTHILELLGRLKQELHAALGDEEIWTESKANKLVRLPSVLSRLSRNSTASSDLKHVVFEKKVTGRYYDIAQPSYEDDDDPVVPAAAQLGDEFTKSLQTDKKDTAGKYKRRALSNSRARRESVCTPNEVAQGEVDQDTPPDSVA